MKLRAGEKIIIFTIICLVIFIVFYSHKSFAANCGGAVACACGDTITSSYTRSTGLDCTNAGVVWSVGANGITIDCENNTISGDDVNTTVIIRNPSYTGVVINNCIVDDATVSGLSLEGASETTTTNFAGNSTGNQGIQHLGTATANHTNLTANNNADDGVSVHGGTVTINGGSFTGNADGLAIVAAADGGACTVIGDDIAITGGTVRDIQIGSSNFATDVTLTNVTIDKTGGATDTAEIIDITESIGTTVDMNVLVINNVPVGTVAQLITIEGGTTTINNANITGNSGDTDTSIFNINGVSTTATVNNSSVYSRFKSFLVANGGTLTLSDSTITGDQLSGSIGSQISNAGSSASFENVVFDTLYQGIFVSTTDDVVTINRCRFDNIIDHHVYDTGSSATVNVYYSIFNETEANKNSLAFLSANAANIYNNIFYDEATRDGRGIIIPSGMTANVKNNIFMNLVYCINNATGAGINVYNNLTYNNVALKTGSAVTWNNAVTSDPLFKNVGTDFDLKLTSPAIYQGVDVSLSTDYNGATIRGAAPNIGAYETWPKVM